MRNFEGLVKQPSKIAEMMSICKTPLWRVKEWREVNRGTPEVFGGWVPIGSLRPCLALRKLLLLRFSYLIVFQLSMNNCLLFVLWHPD